MKVLPNIVNMKCSRLAELEESYTVVTFNESNNVALSYKETNKSNFDILSDLIECKAYATALLYLNENYILSDKYSDLLKDKEIKEFYEDCEELLTKNIKIVEEAGIPLTDINGYKIFEGQGYILRGNGKKKIRESFNERGEIELEDITLDYLKNRKYDAEIIGMRKCPKCGYIFDKDINSFEREEKGIESNPTFEEPYIEKEFTYSVEIVKCPNCGKEENEEDFPWAWVDDLYDAPNGSELVPGIKELDEEVDVFTKKYDELYDDYVKHNPENHLDRLDWFNNLPTSYKNEIEAGLTEEAEGGEGTQTTDIAPKVDQELGLTDAKPKKKYYDILLSDINESLNILNKGFLKNEKGQYQRGNYILVKEGDKYLAVHKDKIEEVDATQAFNNISTIQRTIQEKTGCVVTVERDGERITIRIKGSGSQLNNAMQYGDELKELLKSWGNTVEFNTNTNEFIYTVY